ncbi:MAG TPA: hypothetical protein PLP48_08685 [Acholeplasmataceae bacterium]|nr:hypothetical protein [Acholeplasmataceae bacterium]
MKKLIAFILISIISLFTFGFLNPRAATFVPEPSASVGGLWHVEDGNQAYVYMRYNRIGSSVVETGSKQEHYTNWWTGSEADYSFATATPKQSILANPDPLVYTKFRIELIGNIEVDQGPNPTVTTVLNTEDVDQIEIRITDWDQRPNTNYLYDYTYFDLYVDGVKVLTSRNIDAGASQALGFPENPYFAVMTFGVKMYWSKVTETTVDPDDPNPWAQLPVTTGNPTNPLGTWGEVDVWDFDENTGEFSFTLNYLETLYHVEGMMLETDTAFIEKTKRIAYFTDPITGDRILYMNFSDRIDSMILKNNSVEAVKIWEGEALWNLTQEEVRVVNVMRVYNYIPAIESNGQVYSYFYMPDVPVDDLLSVTVNLGYRYHEKEFPWSSYEPGPIKSKTITLTKGATSEVNPTWVETVYKASFWTSGITAAMMILNTPLGKIPKLGWGIAAASFVIGGLFLVADEYEFFAYDVEQIQHVIPDQTLRMAIDHFIQSKDPTAQPIDTVNNKLYKLNLGTLNSGENPQVLEQYSSVTQIVWETSGSVYVAEDDYINDQWGGPGTEAPSDWWTDNKGWIIIAGIAAVVIFILPSFEKAVGSLSRLIGSPKRLLILAIIVVGALILLGVIRI